MKSKITFAAVVVASLLCRPPATLSQQPRVSYPQVLPGYGPVVPVQYVTVMQAPADPQLGQGQGAPQVPPGSIPQSIVQPAPVVSPLAIGDQAPMYSAAESVACDGCDSCPTCTQCGAPSCDCDCDGVWNGYGGAEGYLGLRERLSALGHCGLGDCGLLSGGSALWDRCFWLCQHPRLSRMCGWLGRGHGGRYPRPSRVWGEAEYLLWWNKNRELPVLVTASVDGTPFDQAGVLGEPGTGILFGGGKIDNAAESGFRAGIGFWLDRYQTWGIGGRYFQLGPEDIGFNAASDGRPILGRPFYNASLDQEDALVVAFPGESSGGVHSLSSNEILGFEAYMRKMLYYGYCNRVDLIFGYHSTQVNDTVRVGHRLVSESDQGLIPQGTVIGSEDRFRAKNEFHGGEIGLMAQGYDGRISWNLLAKVSGGNTRETVTLRGRTIATVPGFGSAISDQGLLVLDSNSGVYEDDEFTVVPEASLSMAYSVTNLVQLSVGYSVIYWTNVALAGDAIDTVVNPTQIGGPLIGPARPTYRLNDGSFWAQGLTFGVHGRF